MPLAESRVGAMLTPPLDVNVADGKARLAPGRIASVPGLVAVRSSLYPFAMVSIGVDYASLERGHRPGESMAWWSGVVASLAVLSMAALLHWHLRRQALATGAIERAQAELAASHQQLLDACAQGSAVLLISEDLDEVFALADRIAVLVYGEVIAFDTPDKVRADPKVKEAYLGAVLEAETAAEGAAV